MKLKHPPGKPIPPKFKTGIECDFARAFSWRERLKILCGFTAIIRVRIPTEFHPGRFAPVMELNLTEKQMQNKT